MHTVTPASDKTPEDRVASPYWPLPDSPWPVIAAAADRIARGLPVLP